MRNCKENNCVNFLSRKFREKKKDNNNKNNNKKNNVPTSNKFKLLVLAFLKFFSVEVSNWKLHTTLRQYGFGGSLPSWFDSHLHNCFQRVTALGLSSKALPVT